MKILGDLLAGQSEKDARGQYHLARAVLLHSLISGDACVQHRIKPIILGHDCIALDFIGWLSRIREDRTTGSYTRVVCGKKVHAEIASYSVALNSGVY